MESFSHSMRLNLQDLQGKFSVFQNNFQLKLGQSFDISNQMIHSNFFATERLARRVFETVNLIRRSDIISDCKSKLIPATLLPAQLLARDLSELSKKLQTEGYDLAIPISDITWYYKIKLTECEISDTKIMVRVKVPIKNKIHHWQLFEMIAIPFAHNDSSCIIVHDSTFVAVSSTAVRTITGVMLHECKPYHNDLCYIPRHSSDVISGSQCPYHMFKGATAEKLNEYCAYKCQTGTGPLVTQIDHERYILTHPPADVNIKCNNNTKLIPNNEKHLPGALEIQLPCPCELLFDNTVKIPRSFPCDKKALGLAQVTRILPSLWSKLQSINIDINTPYTHFTFTNISEVFDKDWQSKVPHFTIDRSRRQIPDSTPYDKIITNFHSSYNFPLVLLLLLWCLAITFGVCYYFLPSIFSCFFQEILTFCYKYACKKSKNISKADQTPKAKFFKNLGIDADNITIAFDPSCCKFGTPSDKDDVVD